MSSTWGVFQKENQLVERSAVDLGRGITERVGLFSQEKTVYGLGEPHIGLRGRRARAA